MHTPDNSNRRAVRAYCEKKFIERYVFKHGKAPTAEQVDKHVSDDMLLARISRLRDEIAKDIWKLVYDCHGARRIKARMVDYGCCAHMRALISLVRLSLWFAYLFGYLRGLVASMLPVVVRFDVARGTRGIVVWVNVARALLSFFWISSRLRESCLYAGLAHVV
jgi:hypothetical protein